MAAAVIPWTYSDYDAAYAALKCWHCNGVRKASDGGSLCVTCARCAECLATANGQVNGVSVDLALQFRELSAAYPLLDQTILDGLGGGTWQGHAPECDQRNSFLEALANYIF